MKTLIISLKIFLCLTILTGIIYPLAVTGIVQLAFPAKANGSLVVKDNRIVGSSLIGQSFDSAIYFWPRPSATGYNPMPSGGSNYGLTNEKLKRLSLERKDQFTVANLMDAWTVVPSEMLFASGSGLDPHISQAAALMQVDRVAMARGLTPDKKDLMTRLIKEDTQTPPFWLTGGERINVLLLNMEIDKQFGNQTKAK